MSPMMSYKLLSSAKSPRMNKPAPRETSSIRRLSRLSTPSNSSKSAHASTFLLHRNALSSTDLACVDSSMIPSNLHVHSCVREEQTRFRDRLSGNSFPRLYVRLNLRFVIGDQR